MSAPGEFVAGDVLAASEMNALGGAQVGYAEVTSSVGSITTSPVTLATVTPSLLANRRIKMTGTWRGVISTVNDDRIRFELVSASVRNEQIVKVDLGSSEMSGSTIVATFNSGAGGAVPCLLRAVRHSGTGTITVQAASTAPISVLVQDIGPA